MDWNLGLHVPPPYKVGGQEGAYLRRRILRIHRPWAASIVQGAQGRLKVEDAILTCHPCRFRGLPRESHFPVHHLFPLWRASCCSSTGCAPRTHRTRPCAPYTSPSSSGFPRVAARPAPRPGGSRAFPVPSGKQRPLAVRVQKRLCLPRRALPASRRGAPPPGTKVTYTKSILSPMAPTRPGPLEPPTIDLLSLLQLGPRHREAQPQGKSWRLPAGRPVCSSLLESSPYPAPSHPTAPVPQETRLEKEHDLLNISQLMQSPDWRPNLPSPHHRLPKVSNHLSRPNCTPFLQPFQTPRSEFLFSYSLIYFMTLLLSSKPSLDCSCS